MADVSSEIFRKIDDMVAQIETEEALEDRYIVLIIDPQLQRFSAHGPLSAVAAMQALDVLRADFDATEDCADIELYLVPCTEP